MKIALIYGYAEGPHIAAKFRETVAASGHDLVEASQAEVIIAHSGGSYMVPNKNRAKLIMLVDVPYYDSHWSFIKKLMNRVVGEGVSVAALRKLGWNSWYMIAQHRRGSEMKKQVIKGAFYGLQGKKVVFIRNGEDIFGTLTQDSKEARRHGWVAKELPGTHDDLWYHPEPYIQLAEKYL